MKSEQECKEDLGLIGKVLALTALMTLILSQVGCAGIGFKAETYRIDERQESQKTEASNTKPLACYLWRDCQGVSHAS